MLLICIVGLAVFAIQAGKVNLINLDGEIAHTIFYKIRLPRVLVAIFVGSALATSGVILQGLLQNPLADAYTLGIASGGAFGACLAIYVNIRFGINMPIQIFAILFSFIVIGIVLWLSKVKGDLESTNVIIAGIIVGSIFSAGLSLLKSLADEDVATMVYWLMGNLSSKPLHKVMVIGVVMLIGFVIAYAFMGELNIITLGRREANSVGISYNFLYRLLMLIAVTLTAFSVSLCGIIGFVGLVVPHLCRIFIGADNRKVLPMSALLGALFLLLADTLTRTILKHEIPVGVLTTMVGGPFFIYIFIAKKR
ncbi:MAG: FecCD family ABC transporter permease [Clostridium sp.]|uniref:FecCD family ABC transporter permease n=1 Tax=Clostridium sp. TaxID=1506 RepID=UPI003D6CCAEF